MRSVIAILLLATLNFEYYQYLFGYRLEINVMRKHANIAETNWSRYCYKLADLFIVIFMGWVSYTLYFSSWDFDEERYSWAILVGGLLATSIFPLFHMYDSWRGKNIGGICYSTAVGYFCWAVSVILVVFIFKLGDKYSRGWLFSWWATAFFIGLLFRILLYFVFIKFFTKSKYGIFLIGDANYCSMISEAISKDKYSEFYISRVFTTNLNGIVADNWFEYSGNFSKESIGGIFEDEVWICLPLSKGEDVISIANDLDKTLLNIRFMPGLQELRLINHNISNFSGIRLLDISCSPMTTEKRLLKRLEDIIIATLILLLIMPIMFVVAMGVKFSSKGPIFYKQPRVSWNGRVFDMLKFRSMPVNNEKNKVEWGNAQNKQVTAFGKFIRKTSLDELPQFINVLKGDMSIVGPRPERDIFVKKFGEEIPGYMQKHMVKAGITGWAQVHGLRGDTSLEKRVEYDLWYIENWSIWLDIKIIFMTFFKIFSDKSAI